jgi:pyrroline-5-carboxylate reductase
LYVAHSNTGSLGTAIVKGLLGAHIDGFNLAGIYLSTRSQQSTQRLATIPNTTQVPVHILGDDHLSVASKSDVVILACPPDAMESLLSSYELKAALSSRVLISVLAGVTSDTIRSAVELKHTRVSVSRVLPNLAVASRRSATAIEISEPALPPAAQRIVDNIFKALGGIIHVPAEQMDAATVLCGSLPAYIALIADGMIDGAVAAGVPREKANAMLSQVIGSTAALLEDQSASSLRESVCAMPGCTIQGNLVLEEGSARAVSARAIKVAIEAARKLG